MIYRFAFPVVTVPIWYKGTASAAGHWQPRPLGKLIYKVGSYGARPLVVAVLFPSQRKLFCQGERMECVWGGREWPHPIRDHGGNVTMSQCDYSQSDLITTDISEGKWSWYSMRMIISGEITWMFLANQGFQRKQNSVLATLPVYSNIPSHYLVIWGNLEGESVFCCAWKCSRKCSSLFSSALPENQGSSDAHTPKLCTGLPCPGLVKLKHNKTRQRVSLILYIVYIAPSICVTIYWVV